MFQRAGLVYADVVPVAGSSTSDIDDKAFNAYFNRRYGQSSEFSGQAPEQLFHNLGLGDGRELNLAGLLLFGRYPQHRDYFTSASIRLMLFLDRIEIISPGHLPDSLSTEAIRRGATNRRNPMLTEHAVHILPYRGLGTGIPRALQDWPSIDLIDDVEANQFVVRIGRQFVDEATPQVTPKSAGYLKSCTVK